MWETVRQATGEEGTEVTDGVKQNSQNACKPSIISHKVLSLCRDRLTCNQIQSHIQ